MMKFNLELFQLQIQYQTCIIVEIVLFVCEFDSTHIVVMVVNSVSSSEVNWGIHGRWIKILIGVTLGT